MIDRIAHILMVGVFGVLTATYSSADLTEPVDVPMGPPDFSPPGASIVPDLPSRFSDDAPQIGAVSDSTGPGETLVITGWGLAGASLRLWSGDQSMDFQPLRSSQDRMQAVVPETLASRGTMLLSPVRDGAVGRPIRINAATAWWVWPCRVQAGTDGRTVRIFGHDLSTRSAPPVVVIQGESGPARKLALVRAGAYDAEAELPDDLVPGVYRLWIHNATGGSFGWSEPVTFRVAPKPKPYKHVVRVDDYLTKGRDVSAAIEAAVSDLRQVGGGSLVFSARTYRLTEPIVLPKDAAIELRGVDDGVWDTQRNELTGRATLLMTSYDIGGTAAIELRGAGSAVRDLALVFTGREHAAGIRLSGPDQRVADSTVVSITLHQTNACIESNYKGEANHEIIRCSLFMFNHAVRVSNHTDFVRIADCRVRGYYSIGRGTLADAVVNWGGNQMIVENCDVRSEDRVHGKAVIRTCLLYKSSIRNCYLANNRSVSVGPHPSIPGVEKNVGEQYLFHYRDEGGGVFEVVDADSHSLGLVGAGSTDTQYGQSLDWIVFIARGKGAGQWRVITGVLDGRLTVDRPWRVVPDESSVAIVQQAFRHNLVVGNHINAAPAPEQVEPEYKAVGVYMFQASFENIVADNTFKNLGVGVSIAANPSSPSAWNLVRNNRLESMVSGPGDAAFGPVFYCENSRGTWPDMRSGVRHWVAVGNIFRSNDCSDAPAAGVVGWWRFGNQPDGEFEPDADRGLMMSVIENNTFTGVSRGILIGAPATWPLVRNNALELLRPGPPTVELNHPARVTDAMVVEPLPVAP